jgi:hypothetical protein
MEKYYLTTNLFIERGKIYFENIESTESKLRKIKINNRNMFKYLEDYGWEKMPIQYRRKLNNNNFLLLECGADGNCLFHVIAEALNNNMLTRNSGDFENVNLYDVESLREIASNCISEENFEFILNTYKMEIMDGEFNGEWDPNLVENIDDFKNEIKKSGDNFWGDHTILQLLSEKLCFNVIIFNSPNELGECNIYKSDFENSKYDKTILIYYDSSIHFNLIGYFDKNLINTLFNQDTLPYCLK